jgi:MoaA/NifB/PqqE/SkfB family radical SAM enzyme
MKFADPLTASYLAADPLAAELAQHLSRAQVLRPIVVDITHKCNIRCQGCYFFSQEMDRHKPPASEDAFDAFLEAEQARGTTYVTVAGGEPALMPDRLLKLHRRFRTMPFTNGMVLIPKAGFEDMPIAVSVWGDHATDTRLRGSGRTDVFAQALRNYRDDPRVTWYYTTTAGNAAEIESVTRQIVDNGNLLLYSFYEDHQALGGAFDHRRSFHAVRREIDRMIERYPDRILTTSYINRVATEGRLLGRPWGFDACPVVDMDHPANHERRVGGEPAVPGFRAYYADLRSRRRCSVGEASDCGSCFNVFAKMTWIGLQRQAHLLDADRFFDWLSASFVQHAFVRAVGRDAACRLLPRIHARHQGLRDGAGALRRPLRVIPLVPA